MEKLIRAMLGDWFYERGRELILMLWSVALGVVIPLKSTITFLFFCFVFNCLFGIWADKAVSKRFKMEKLKEGFYLLITYFILIILINQSMVIYEEYEYAQFLVKCISWFFSWHYWVNIVRNTIIIWPNAEALKTLYRILTIDVKFFIENKFREKLGLRKKEQPENNN